MPITAKIIEDSVNSHGNRLTTFQLLYPRFIHAELMTHRVFSRNASSSRAIPVKKMLEMIRNEPAMPIHWGANQPGMQANNELGTADRYKAEVLWREAAQKAASVAERMMELGLHKQVANRILEPFQHISVVLTTTELDNWRELRRHKDAQPEIHALAITMDDCLEESTPVYRTNGDWHLPYILPEERLNLDIEILKQVSAARCCRVSYLKHDGSASNIDEDLALCQRLAGARPIHASPFEHQATPDFMVYSLDKDPHWDSPNLHGNFNGWIQYRKLIECSFKLQ